ncbi:MAG: hypothetical protein LBD12_06200 [Clostridiales Family XIII bacterium]|jgi:hypothetical protein|nr:hypothetical protein [Clostridiales Family XIII bacterium]
MTAVTIAALFALLVVREALSYIERRRLHELLAAKDLTEFRSMPASREARVNLIQQMRENERGSKEAR